jgi:glycosyltransferase involved in cell wall biosynthesis
MQPSRLTAAPDVQRLPRVLQVGKFYPPHVGGMESHLRTLCMGIRDRANVEVIVSAGGRRTAHSVIGGIPVSRVGTLATLASAPLCPGMAREIAGRSCDLVHLHHPNPAAFIAYLASRNRSKLVVTYHSDTVRQRVSSRLYEPVLRRVLDRADAIIATSPEYLASSPLLRRYDDRTMVIPLGTDVSALRSVERSEIWRVRQKFGGRLVLSVGRLVYYKGLEYLIRAMRAVDGTLLIVGDGPLRAQLEQLAAGLELQQRVVFLGAVDEVGPYYHAADVFALPSCERSEAFGLVQVEAMACGTPVVNTDLRSGVTFVSPHGVTGFTVPRRNPPALAAALNRLLDDAPLRSALGAAAMHRAMTEFNEERMADRTMELYHRVLHRHAAFQAADEIAQVS